MRVADAREVLGVSIRSDLAELSGNFEALGSEVVGELLRKEDPSTELEAWRTLTEAFETVVSNYAQRNSKRDEEDENSGHKGTSSRWPEALEVETARSLLLDWADKERWADPDSFASDFELSNLSFAKYTLSRIIETRKELVRSVAGRYEPPAGNTFTGAIADASVPAQENLAEVTYELHRPETVSTDACDRCRGSGRSRCLGCSGSGQVNCQTTERCRVCHGTGKLSEYRDGSQRESRCTACHGSGNVTCPKCQGSGSVNCSSCRGRGDIDCSECSTTGLITTYKAGLVERKRENKSTGAWPDAVPSPKVALKSIPLNVKLRGYDVPAWIPPEDQGELQAILRKHPREVYRELGIQIWPVTRVNYSHKGKTRILFIIGSERTVVDPSVRRRKRAWTTAITVGVAAAIGAAIWALLASGLVG